MKSQTKSTNMQCNVKKTNHKKDHAFSLFKYIYIFMLNIMQKKQEKRKENLIIIKLLYVYIVTQ